MMRITGKKIRRLKEYKEFLSILLKSLDNERLYIDSEINIGEIESCYDLILNIGKYDKELFRQFSDLYLEQAQNYYNNIAKEITKSNSASACIDEIISCKKKEFLICLDQTPQNLKEEYEEMFNKTVILQNIEIILNVLMVYIEKSKFSVLYKK